jgi:hypothetical protein
MLLVMIDALAPIVFSVVLIAFGGFVLTNVDTFMAYNRAWAMWWYRKTNFELYKWQSERLSSSYARNGNLLLVAISIVVGILISVSKVFELSFIVPF